MPKIRILTSIAGFREGRDFTWAVGDVVEVDQATANGYVSCDYAELVEEKKRAPKGERVERAVLTPTETRGAAA